MYHPCPYNAQLPGRNYASQRNTIFGKYQVLFRSVTVRVAIMSPNAARSKAAGPATGTIPRRRSKEASQRDARRSRRQAPGRFTTRGSESRHSRESGWGRRPEASTRRPSGTSRWTAGTLRRPPSPRLPATSKYTYAPPLVRLTASSCHRHQPPPAPAGKAVTWAVTGAIIHKITIAATQALERCGAASQHDETWKTLRPVVNAAVPGRPARPTPPDHRAATSR